MYLTAPRPYIINDVSLLSRYMHCASEIHLQAAKRIVRYIKGTIDFGIKLKQEQNFHFHEFSNSDWVGCVDDMRIVLALVLVFFHGVQRSKKPWLNPQLRQSILLRCGCKSSLMA